MDRVVYILRGRFTVRRRMNVGARARWRRSLVCRGNHDQLQFLSNLFLQQDPAAAVARVAYRRHYHRYRRQRQHQTYKFAHLVLTLEVMFVWLTLQRWYNRNVDSNSFIFKESER